MSHDPRTYAVQAQSKAVVALRALLQEKHLYQSIVVDGDVPHQPGAPPGIQSLERFARAMVAGDWIPVDPLDAQLKAAAATPAQAEKFFYLRLPDVRLFCATCDRLEPFNPVSATDFITREQRPQPYTLNGARVQVFVLSYQCQGCKGVPEVFLVRRQGLKLTNAGRAPIEHVEVPRDIPKSVGRFFSGAVVAHQSGQTLAGLFLLRTLVEQFAREMTASTAVNADEVIDGYMGMLPADLKSRFPSMKDLYGLLSADLHSATGSPDLFDRAKAEIVQHFEVRRVFKLTDTRQPAADERTRHPGG